MQALVARVDPAIAAVQGLLPAGFPEPTAGAIFDGLRRQQGRWQAGLQSLQTDWVDISRGLGREESIDPPGALRQMATDELVVRGQFRAWLDYMSEA